MEKLMHQYKNIVIVGPQGCGKTILAELIAKAVGTTGHTSIMSIVHKGRDLVEYDTLIVDVPPMPKRAALRRRHIEMIEAIKPTIVESLLTAVQAGQVVTVPTPNFIFCTGSLDALNLSAQDRRFFVIDLGGKHG